MCVCAGELSTFASFDNPLPPIFSRAKKKKKRGEKEERKEGGKAGIAPWKLARLEKGEDSRKLKPACRRRQWGREKFDLDFPRNWYAYQYTGSFITLVDNSVLTRRLIRKTEKWVECKANDAMSSMFSFD